MMESAGDTGVNISRRSALGCCVATLATHGIRSAQLPECLVDTHLHCFAGPSDPRFPYHEDAPYRPLDAATPQHLISCMDAAGVDHAIVVHPEPYQDDHRYLEYCLQHGRGRLKGTCLFFADDPTATQRLQQLSERADLVAARIHAYAPGRLPPFGTPELRQYWRTAGESGLAIQLHFEPRYSSAFEPLIREFPDFPVLIDHLGRPFQGTADEHATVIRWGKLPNTIIKLSSIPSPLKYPHRDPAPTIRRLCDSYGPSRMMYGGGFNAAADGDSYRAAFERGCSYLDHWSADEQAQVLGENARRLFRFGEI